MATEDPGPSNPLWGVIINHNASLGCCCVTIIAMADRMLEYYLHLIIQAIIIKAFWFGA